MFRANNFNILNKANKLLFTKNISFEINTNEIWRIIGANGIGKSSLFESLLGIRGIHHGELFFNGHNLNKVEAWKRPSLGMKFILQGNLFFDDLSILENLKIFSEYLLNYDEREDAVHYAIETFNLKHFVNKTPKQLSGGQRRVSELSKMVIGKNDFILLDEPFAAIDLTTVESLIYIFLILKEKGKSFLINDHNIDILTPVVDCDIIITPETKISLNKSL